MVTVKWSHWLPKLLSKYGLAHAITWKRTIYLADDYLSESLFKHEYAHVLQFQRYLWFEFLFIYLKDYLVNLFKFGFDHSKAYRNIPFEVEAYQRQVFLLDPAEAIIYREILKTSPRAVK